MYKHLTFDILNYFKSVIFFIVKTQKSKERVVVDFLISFQEFKFYLFYLSSLKRLNLGYIYGAFQAFFFYY